MPIVPETSMTLLKALANDTQDARWGEFFNRYQPMMKLFLEKNFPSVDVDDVIQETLIALINVLPRYRYVPEEKGSFHNYLTGILQHKAYKMITSESRRSEVYQNFAKDPTCDPESMKQRKKGWQDAVFEIALQQLLADETIQDRTKQIFVQVALRGEPPMEVAESFGVDRNVVDQIKCRMVGRLRELVKSLEGVNDI